MKFKLHDIRDSKVWQEARDEGRLEGKEEGKLEGKEEGKKEGALAERKRNVHHCLASGMSHREIAKLLKIPLSEIERLANGRPI